MSRKQKKYHYIYKTTDTRNGNYYIGMHSTDDLNDGYVGSGDRIKHIKYKHGKEIFNIEILEFLPDRESLKKREAEIVNSELLLEDNCMNLRPGGEGGFCGDDHKKKFLDEGRKNGFRYGKKANEQFLKLFADDEYKKRFSEKISDGVKHYLDENGLNGFWDGKHHTDETKQKMSQKAKERLGEKNSQFGTMWITNGVENKKIKNDQSLPNGWHKGRTK